MAPRSCRTAEGPPSTAEPARSRSLVPAELIEQRPQSLRVRARIVCTVTPIVTCADCPSIAQLIQARALSSIRLFTVDTLGSRALVITLPKPSYAEKPQ